MDGHSATNDLAARSMVGYVPQDVALYPDLTASENLAFSGASTGSAGRYSKSASPRPWRLTDLTDRRNDRVDSFSGGMKRRLNIAAGLLHHPKLLVLDEPTVGVDPQSRHAILERVQSFGRSGMSVLYTTHYMEEAERVCDRVGIIDQGRLIAEGTRRELVARLGERDRIDLSASGDLEELAAACRAVTGVVGAAAADELRAPHRRRRPTRPARGPRGGEPCRSLGQQRGGQGSRPRGGVPAPHRHRTAGVTMPAPLLIAGKDLRQRVRDRSAIVIGLVAPLVIAALMSVAFKGADTFHYTLGVVDADHGPVATALEQSCTSRR